MLVQAAGLEKATIHDRTFQDLTVPELIVLALASEQVLVWKALAILLPAEFVAGLFRVDHFEFRLAHVLVLTQITVPS